MLAHTRVPSGRATAAILHYYTTLYGPLILSAFVVVVLQVPILGLGNQVGTASVLSGVAALMSTVGAFGNFKDKWFANRDALLTMELISLERGKGSLDQKEGIDRVVAQVLIAFNERWGRSA